MNVDDRIGGRHKKLRLNHDEDEIALEDLLEEDEGRGPMRKVNNQPCKPSEQVKQVLHSSAGTRASHSTISATGNTAVITNSQSLDHEVVSVANSPFAGCDPSLQLRDVLCIKGSFPNEACFIDIDGPTFRIDNNDPGAGIPFAPCLSKKGTAYCQHFDIAWAYGEIGIGIVKNDKLYVAGFPFSNLDIPEIKDAINKNVLITGPVNTNMLYLELNAKQLDL